MILSEGLVLWTAEQAAQAVGVERNTIDVWIHRGHLQRASAHNGTPLVDDDGCMLFWANDIADLAERKKSLAGGAREIPTPTLPDDITTAVWTFTEIVQSVGVSKTSVKRWIDSGGLSASGCNAEGEPVFRVLDVARVERANRRRSGRRFV